MHVDFPQNVGSWWDLKLLAVPEIQRFKCHSLIEGPESNLHTVLCRGALFTTNT